MSDIIILIVQQIFLDLYLAKFLDIILQQDLFLYPSVNQKKKYKDVPI